MHVCMPKEMHDIEGKVSKSISNHVITSPSISYFKMVV